MIVQSRVKSPTRQLLMSQWFYPILCCPICFIHDTVALNLFLTHVVEKYETQRGVLKHPLNLQEPVMHHNPPFPSLHPYFQFKVCQTRSFLCPLSVSLPTWAKVSSNSYALCLYPRIPAIVCLLFYRLFGQSVSTTQRGIFPALTNIC